MIPSFPLVAGAVSVQLPTERSWTPAQALVTTPGGDWHVKTLPTGEHVEWQLAFSGLSADEARTLREFHREVRGSYHSFRFCDPLRNLLAWSEDPTKDPWTRSSGLAISLQPGPETGAMQSAQVLNLSGAEGVLSQAVACSPGFAYSLAVTAKSNSRSQVALVIGGQRKSVALSEQWQKYQFTAVPGGTVDQVTFGLAIPMGGAVELAGAMAEFGRCVPEYRRSDGMQGLFPRARFKDDLLLIRGERGGAYSASVTVVAKVGE